MAAITRINVALFGRAGVGKSMALNALASNMLAQCSKKRTTLHPHVYTETVFNGINAITSNIHADKKAEPKEYKDIRRIDYAIPRIFGINDLVENVILSFHDLPGLNEHSTKNIYQTYVTNNFHTYDIILFITDINSAMPTSDEAEILTLIMNGIKSNKKSHIETKLFILFNKCDDMALMTGVRMPRDSEMRDTYNTGIKSINAIISKVMDGYIPKFVPSLFYQCYNISFENAFIYRMIQGRKAHMLDEKYINKVGIIEFGHRVWNTTAPDKKLDMLVGLPSILINRGLNESGFDDFMDGLNEMLDPNLQHRYAMNRLYHEMKSIINVDPNQLSLDGLIDVRLTYHNIHQLQNKFKAFSIAGLEDYSITQTALKVLDEKVISHMEHHIAYAEQHIPKTTDINVLLKYREQLYNSSWVARKISAPLFKLVDDSISIIYITTLRNYETTLQELNAAITGMKKHNIDGRNEVINMFGNIEKYKCFDSYQQGQPNSPAELCDFILSCDVDIQYKQEAIAKLTLYDLKAKTTGMSLEQSICNELMYDIVLLKKYENYISPYDKYWFLFRQINHTPFNYNNVLNNFTKPIQPCHPTYLSILLSNLYGNI